MTYATLAGLVARYGADMLRDLTDRADPPTGEIDEAVAEGALDHADAVIDGYLAGRYQLPLTEIPPRVTSLAEEVAIWRLHRHTPDAKIEADYKQAVASLKDIANGIQRLPLPLGGEPVDTGAGGVTVTDRERPMTADNLRGFI